MVTEEMTIEELVAVLPESVSYLMEKGIKCLACGEPIWGTLGDAARERGYSPSDLRRFVEDLNVLALKSKR